MFMEEIPPMPQLLLVEPDAERQMLNRSALLCRNRQNAVGFKLFNVENVETLKALKTLNTRGGAETLKRFNVETLKR